MTQERFQPFHLDGRTALVTGEHSAALLESGATVILTDIDATRLERSRAVLAATADASRIRTMIMDVISPDSIRAVARDLTERVDILVNNAAIDPKVKNDGMVETSRLENFTLEQWNLELSVGLTGAFLCSQTFGAAMARDGKGGVILNIASDLSVFSPDQRLYRKDQLPPDRQPVKPVTYSAIKAGLVGLTRYLATYWSDQGVRCNALSPGGVYTDQNEEFVRRLTSLIPLGRMARREEYRAAVQFMCSDASAYLNGQNIVMDGGRSAW